VSQFQVAVAGVGGQGALLFGRLLAEAGRSRYEHVSYFPHYATIMRGGQSECTVIISHQEISSPITFELQAVIIMHPQFVEQYQNRVQPGGRLFLDSSVVPHKITREDIEVFYIPATKSAIELGDDRVANLVLLGAYLEATKAVPLELVEKALEGRLRGGRGEALLPLNKEALRQGARLITNYGGWKDDQRRNSY